MKRTIFHEAVIREMLAGMGFVELTPRVMVRHEDKPLAPGVRPAASDTRLMIVARLDDLIGDGAAVLRLLKRYPYGLDALLARRAV